MIDLMSALPGIFNAYFFKKERNTKMIKKTITYTDYNGNERTENFYFGLNKAEIMDMELSVTGGMRQLLQMIIDKQDIPKIIEAFKKIIKMSYGEKSPDGRRFIKSEELTEAFVQTEAYSELYMELIGDAEAAANFINGIVPADIGSAMAAKRAEEKGNGDANLLHAVEASKE